MPPVILEADIGRHAWPDFVRIGRADLFLVDDTDPTLKPLWEGDPTLGWEGDQRLRVYACPLRGTWELVRFEANGTYTSVSRFTHGSHRVPDMVGQWLVFLVTHDVRRGFDPVAASVAHNDKLDADIEKRFDEEMTDANQHLAWGLRKDGVDLFGGQFPVPDTSNIGSRDSTPDVAHETSAP